MRPRRLISILVMVSIMDRFSSNSLRMRVPGMGWSPPVSLFIGSFRTSCISCIPRGGCR